MTNWDITRYLLGNATFHWRKFFVFILVITIAGGGLVLLNKQGQIQASTKIVEVPVTQPFDQQVMDVIVSPNGKVTSNGKDISKSFKILPDSYEISILALDKPGTYLPQFQVIMHLPGDVTQKEVEQRVYAVHGIGSHGEYLSDSRTLVYAAVDIDQTASYTVVAHLPKSILTPPVGKQMLFTLSQISVKGYLLFAVGLPLLTLIILISMILRRRQDQIFVSSTKMINQLPSNCPPAVVGALVDGQVGAREIAATLIDLANRGFLFINRHNDGTYSFGKRKNLNIEKTTEIREFERILLSKIFEPDQYKSTGEDVDMRIGRHIFSRKIAQVYLNIYNEATNLGYFAKSPVKVHLKWRFSGIGLFFLGLLGFVYAAFFVNDSKFFLLLWVSAMIVASIIIWLSALMPVRSVTGATALRQWLQLRQYLRATQPIGGGEVIMDKFKVMLPYAIVFGVEPEWTRRFLREAFAKPEWYESEEPVVTLEVFVGGLFPIINYVGGSLDKSHEPTVE